MSSAQVLSARHAALTSTVKEIQQLNQRLASPQLTAPSDNDPSSSADDLRADLTAEIHAHLRSCAEELALLKQDVEDLLPYWASAGTGGRRPGKEAEVDSETRRLQTGCVKVEEDLKLARVRFRKAQLLAKQHAERAQQRRQAAYLSSLQAAAAAAVNTSPAPASSPSDNTGPTGPSHSDPRAALFHHRRNPRHHRSPEQTQQDLLLSATTDVTTSLRRTHALLTNELSRSRFAQETLEASNAALGELNERYGSFGELLERSRGLIGTLMRSQKSDTWYLETAIWVLVATIGWLVFRRVLYGPLWWFVWVPLKMIWWVFGAVWGVVGLGGGEVALREMTRSTTVLPSAWGGVHATVGGASGGVTVASESQAKISTSLSDPLSSIISTSASASGTSPMLSQTAQSEEHAQEEFEQDSRQRQHSDQNQGNIDNQARRGDGEPLRARDEANEPRNPKKRMLEEPVQERTNQRKDEL